jgi:hypothetical protein
LEKELKVAIALVVKVKNNVISFCGLGACDFMMVIVVAISFRT